VGSALAVWPAARFACRDRLVAALIARCARAAQLVPGKTWRTIIQILPGKAHDARREHRPRLSDWQEDLTPAKREARNTKLSSR